VEKEKLNGLTNKIIGLAIEVHKQLGPGFDEKIYSRALEGEFIKTNIRFEKENLIDVKYKNKRIGEHRLDFLIEDELILELKASAQVVDVHLAQLLSYLKAIDKRLGLVLNFGARKLEIKRVVNKF
jgi:GxxExxY protein